MAKKVLGCFGILLLLALCASIVLNVALLSFGGAQLSAQKVFQESLLEGSSLSRKGRVAVVDLFGVISYGVPGQVNETMVDDLAAKLKQAREDASVKAIVLRIDSPGGEVTASDILYREVLRTDEVKPVIAYIESVGASGAYYAAMGSRRVIAHELGITASIGVILQTLNVEQLATKVGVSALTFKSGKMKDLLNPARAPTEEEKVYVQGLIDETYDKFVGIVAERRKMNEKALRAELADGRIVSGKLAAAAGLIDATGYFEDALAEARKAADLPEDAPVVRLVAPFTFSSFLRTWGEAPKTPAIQIEFGPRMPGLEAGKLYYLSPHLFGR